MITYKPEIRFADIDSYGIVHNAIFLLYFEQSRIALFSKIAGEWNWTKNGVLVAHQEVDYRRPVRLTDKLEIVIWVEEMGEKSITCAYQAFLLTERGRELSTESKTVIVCYDSIQKSTVPIPEEWRIAISSQGLLGRPEGL